MLHRCLVLVVSLFAAVLTACGQPEEQVVVDETTTTTRVERAKDETVMLLAAPAILDAEREAAWWRAVDGQRWWAEVERQARQVSEPQSADHDDAPPRVLGSPLPPDSVCWRESRCTYGVVNPTGCGGRGCFGKWQFDPRTWAAVARAYPELGLPAHPRDATPEQEDAAAAALWDSGRGCAHWAACR